MEITLVVLGIVVVAVAIDVAIGALGRLDQRRPRESAVTTEKIVVDITGRDPN